MPENMDDEIVFIGKVTASVTHEIKNVLASIKELTGLMEDLVSMSGDFPLKDKFQNVIPRIINQIERGSELTKNFNTFSHVPDLKNDNIDLGAVTELLVYLCQRFARQKNIELKVSESNTSIVIETNPLKLYMGLFYVIEYFLNQINNDSIIKIGTEQQGNEIKINMVCEGEITDREEVVKEMQSSEKWNAVQNFINSLNGKVEYSDTNSCISVLLPSNVYSGSS